MANELLKKPKILDDAPLPTDISFVPFVLGRLASSVDSAHQRMDEGFKRNDDAQAATNEHLKTLNGKVAAHEKKFNDIELFRDSITSEAKEKAEAAAAIQAQRTSAIWSIGISLATLLAVGIVTYLVYHYTHINLIDPSQ